MTIGELLAEGRRRLALAPHRPSTREAGLLLARLLDLDEAQLLARDGEPVAPAVRRRFEQWLDRRLEGEPVAYLLGEREFYGRSFVVDRRVLIPRPETEHLIEAVLGLDLPPSPLIVDIGTGCGAIAVILALELPEARVVATDRSMAALAVAGANRRRHGLSGRLRLVATDLACAILPESVDLVVSNPPYLGRHEERGVSPEVREYEPAVALFAGARGDELLGRLLEELSPLSSGTPLCLEVGADQAADVRRLAVGSEFALREIRPDLAGRDRVAILERR